MCQLDFPLWDQASRRSQDERVTHILGQDYLVPNDLNIQGCVALANINQRSDLEITAELWAIVNFADTDHDPVHVVIPVRIKTNSALGERFFDPDRPHRMKRCIELLAGLKTLQHRRNLGRCLDVSLRRRQVRQNRLERAVPQVIKVR